MDVLDTNCIRDADIYMEMEVASIIFAAERESIFGIWIYTSALLCFALLCLFDFIIFIDIVCD